MTFGWERSQIYIFGENSHSMSILLEGRKLQPLENSLCWIWIRLIAENLPPHLCKMKDIYSKKRIRITIDLNSLVFFCTQVRLRRLDFLILNNLVSVWFLLGLCCLLDKFWICKLISWWACWACRLRSSSRKFIIKIILDLQGVL